MKTKSEALFSYLKQLQSYNDKWTREHGHLQQTLFPPEAIPKGVPVLERGIYRAPSQMLQVRFSFVGSWRRAYCGHTFLSVSEMESVWDDPKVQEDIEIRKENWEESPLRLFPPSHVTLFGYYREQGEEIYLVWNDHDREPNIVSYASNFEERFTDLGDFILYCTCNT